MAGISFGLSVAEPVMRLTMSVAGGDMVTRRLISASAYCRAAAHAMGRSMPDLDTMPAGRELDALVAERVMGWKYYASGYGVAAERPYWVSQQGPFFAEYLAHFSESIAAAWLVVERMDSQLRLQRYRLDGWVYAATVGGGYAEADTAPLAICRAALKAVEG